LKLLIACVFNVTVRAAEEPRRSRRGPLEKTHTAFWGQVVTLPRIGAFSGYG